MEYKNPRRKIRRGQNCFYAILSVDEKLGAGAVGCVNIKF